MTISELQSRLESLRLLHGDLQVHLKIFGGIDYYYNYEDELATAKLINKEDLWGNEKPYIQLCGAEDRGAELRRDENSSNR